MYNGVKSPIVESWTAHSKFQVYKSFGFDERYIEVIGLWGTLKRSLDDALENDTLECFATEYIPNDRFAIFCLFGFSLMYRQLLQIPFPICDPEWILVPDSDSMSDWTILSSI